MGFIVGAIVGAVLGGLGGVMASGGPYGEDGEQDVGCYVFPLAIVGGVIGGALGALFLR